MLWLLEIYCGECHSKGDNGAAFASGLALQNLLVNGLIRTRGNPRLAVRSRGRRALLMYCRGGAAALPALRG